MEKTARETRYVLISLVIAGSNGLSPGSLACNQHAITASHVPLVPRGLPLNCRHKREGVRLLCLVIVCLQWLSTVYCTYLPLSRPMSHSSSSVGPALKYKASMAVRWSSSSSEGCICLHVFLLHKTAVVETMLTRMLRKAKIGKQVISTTHHKTRLYRG